jgi:hypothetical protein
MAAAALTSHQQFILDPAVYECNLSWDSFGFVIFLFVCSVFLLDILCVVDRKPVDLDARSAFH